MSVQPDLDQIINLAESVASSLGLVLVDARLSQPGRRRSLEITVHHPERPIGLSDCEALSRKLEVLLDEQSPPLVEGPYNLDVQSPGIDRILKTDREFEIFRGYPVEVKSKDNLEGLGYSFTGTLLEKSRNSVTFARPRPFPGAASGAAGKKREPGPAPCEQISLALDRLVQVRLYPEDLPSDHAETATVL
jgi:ribosome maturation factor RimP